MFIAIMFTAMLVAMVTIITPHVRRAITEINQFNELTS